MTTVGAMRSAGRRRLLVAIIVLAVAAVVLLRPVCTPIDREAIASLDPPIETRSDRELGFFKVFQRRDGQWYQCRAYVSRLLFF